MSRRALPILPPTPPLRRRLLLGTAALLASPVFIRHARAQSRLALTPSQTEGPYYPVAMPRDDDFDLLRNGDRRYAKGRPAWVTGRVLDPAGQPLKGGVVEIWQCDEDGRYDHPRDGSRMDPSFQGFGRVTLNGEGAFRFRTIRPAAYSGRTPHIHAKVKLGQKELLTTQLYVEGDPGNARDFLWNRLSAAGREALTRPYVPTSDGLSAEYTLVVQA
jgi:protocatechuate 3,4-dioxygenase, beta subunit